MANFQNKDDEEHKSDDVHDVDKGYLINKKNNMAVEEKGNGIAEFGTQVAGKENEIAELGDAILVYSKPMGSNNTELDRENVEVVADSFESIEAVDKSRELNANHLVGNAVEKPIEKSTNNCRQLIFAVLCSANETLGIAATDGCIEYSNLQVNWDLAHMPKSLEIPRAITSVGLNHCNSVESRWSVIPFNRTTLGATEKVDKKEKNLL